MRTADIVAPTGIASYAGGTEAISGSGKTYSGTMELQVRFAADLVSGVVSNLRTPTGQHGSTTSPTSTGSCWTTEHCGATARGSTPARLVRTRPCSIPPTRGCCAVDGLTNTFAGRLLGRGADAGSEANGVWSLGNATTGTTTT